MFARGSIEAERHLRQVQDDAIRVSQRIDLRRQILADRQFERGRLAVVQQPDGRRLDRTALPRLGRPCAQKERQPQRHGREKPSVPETF